MQVVITCETENIKIIRTKELYIFSINDKTEERKQQLMRDVYRMDNQRPVEETVEELTEDLKEIATVKR